MLAYRFQLAKRLSCRPLLVMALGRPPYALLASALFIPGLLFRGQKIRSWVTGLVLSGSVVMVTVLWWVAYLSSIKSLAKPSPIHGVFDANHSSSTCFITRQF